MPLINIPKTLSGMKVGLSGAMPDPEELAARRWSDFDIRTAVSFFVEAVLRRGGQIVHGTHPTYLPLIEAVVRSLSEGDLVPDGKRPVKMYVVGPYVKEPEGQALRAMHEGYADVEVVGPFATDDWTPETASNQKSSALKVMRTKMAEQIDALVCIGGRGVRPDLPRPGVLEEIAAAANAGKPYYLAAALGGFANVVHAKKLAENLSSSPNGLEQVQNNQLVEAGDPSIVTELVVKGLQRVWTSRPEGSVQLNSFSDVQRLLNNFVSANGIDLGGSPHSDFWNTDYYSFVTGDVPGLHGVKILTKGHADDSNLILILRGRLYVGGIQFPRMPANGPYMAAEQVNALADWINRGCPQ
jgi:putative intracellular protease/amidase